MTDEARSRSGRPLVGVIGWLFRRVIMSLALTWRIETTQAERVAASLRDASEPFIVTVWHNRIVMAVPYLLRRFHRAGRPMAVVTSASRDGELVARTLDGWGVHAVRGSSSRGALAAVRGAVQAIRRLGASPVIVPDGPRGPAYTFQPGVVQMSRLSGAPVVALGLAADRYWTVGSWDRLMIPRPFARVSVVLGEPRSVSRDLSAPAQEAEIRRHAHALSEATRAAEAAVGAPGSLPLPRTRPPGPEADMLAP